MINILGFAGSLRQSFITLDMHAVNKPEVFVTFAAQKFDAEGKLVDEKTRETVRSLLKTLVEKARPAAGKT
ncbi:MAG: hypothetical protein C4542_08295 [Dehalococcoidia bacterium]|nr:MAG: hypothetical protein C4542_08295 [Dehalococcoidia bacterium]